MRRHIACGNPGVVGCTAALVEFGRRSDEEVGEIGPSFAAIEGEVSVWSTGVTLVDLQIPEPPQILMCGAR
jgi:hypothetical protein